MFIGAIIKKENLTDTSGTFPVLNSGPELSVLLETSDLGITDRTEEE